MLLQELTEEYLINLTIRLDFEIEIRTMVHDPTSAGRDPWMQPMYLIPMWNIIEKIKSFTSYFDKLNVQFPFFEVYRHPIDLNSAFPDSMISIKEQEFTFMGDKIKVAYKYIA